MTCVSLIDHITRLVWMRRPAEMWIHWTFHVKTVGCDSYTITKTQSTLFPVVNLFICVTEVVFNLLWRNEISRGSVATHLRCGGIFSGDDQTTSVQRSNVWRRIRCGSLQKFLDHLFYFILFYMSNGSSRILPRRILRQTRIETHQSERWETDQ